MTGLNLDDLDFLLAGPGPFAPVADADDPEHEPIADLTGYPRDTYKIREWGLTSSDGNQLDRDKAPILNADVVGSKIKGTDLHTVMIDLDVPAKLIPSTTPGHSHLYIDVPMEWDRYAALLKALTDAGVVEDGYASVSIERGETFLRLPWVRKGADATKGRGASMWADAGFTGQPDDFTGDANSCADVEAYIAAKRAEVIE